MWCDIYPLLSILWWNLLAQWMKFVYTRGWSEYWTYFFLPRFDKGAPTWFTCGWAWAELWDDNLKDCVTYRKKCRPSPIFYLHYRRVARDRYSDWVAQAAKNVATPLVDAVSTLLGTLAHSYTTFSSWLEAIRTRVGTWVPTWADNLASAASKLYNWFPAAIRRATATWGDIWDDIKTAVKDWATARFDAARLWVANTSSWLVAGYNTVRTWYDNTASWLTKFKEDAYGKIVGWLGAPWNFLKGAWWQLRKFYNEVWSPYKVTLHDFLADPLGWLYDRVEEELIRRW